MTGKPSTASSIATTVSVSVHVTCCLPHLHISKEERNNKKEKKSLSPKFFSLAMWCEMQKYQEA